MVMFDDLLSSTYPGNMQNEFKNLYKYLDKRFIEVNRRIDNLIVYSDRRFDKIDDQFNEVYDHFDQVDARLWVLESDYKTILNNLS